MRGTYQIESQEGQWVIMRLYGDGIKSPRKNSRIGTTITYKSKSNAEKALSRLPPVFYYGNLAQCAREEEEDNG